MILRKQWCQFETDFVSYSSWRHGGLIGNMTDSCPRLKGGCSTHAWSHCVYSCTYIPLTIPLSSLCINLIKVTRQNTGGTYKESQTRCSQLGEYKNKTSQRVDLIVSTS